MNLFDRVFTQARKRKQALSTVLIAMVSLGIILSMAGCGGAQGNEPVKATWVIARIAGNTVSIPASELESSKIVHFMVGTATGDIAFMAYKLGRKVYVRANVCPPCLSVGFSIQKDILVCDTCRTTFQAKTGDGIKGACINYPKASVSYRLLNGSVVMSADDLLTAYQNTLKPGWP